MSLLAWSWKSCENSSTCCSFPAFAASISTSSGILVSRNKSLTWSITALCSCHTQHNVPTTVSADWLSRYVILDLRLWLTGPPMHDYWSRDFFLLPFLRCDVVALGCVVLICFVELSFIFVIDILLLKKSGCVVFLECSAPSCDTDRVKVLNTS